MIEPDFLTPFYMKGFFGAYPTQMELDYLHEQKFDFIVRLTVEHEKNIEPYQTNIPLVLLPIKDNHVPHDWERFTICVLWIVQQLQCGKQIFVHCKGGHGRSCLIVACILYCVKHTFNARDAIEETIGIHNQRTNMSLRWKSIKSPFSKNQYIFLYKFLNPICILKSYNTGYQAGFSGSSLFEIDLGELGTFSNVDAAFQAIRNTPSFTDNYSELMRLTRLKFERYPELKENLLHTGIRRIYDHSRYAFGNNLIGRCLMELRSTLLLENADDVVFRTDGLNSSEDKQI
jgi:hypothetical protein